MNNQISKSQLSDKDQPSQMEIPSSKIENRLPWQPPKLQRLAITLDTCFAAGSGGDGFTSTT